LLRERRLSAQGECSTGGDAFATVAATFTASVVRFGFVPTHAMEHPTPNRQAVAEAGLPLQLVFA
jgi:hypothetical protein